VNRESKSKRVVLAAVAANGALAVSKFIIAAIGGSSAILSEAFHSLVDTLNESLLLIGLRRSKHGPDAAHPFGHGKELYFWSLIVAVLLFGVGGGLSIYEGIAHLAHPREIGSYGWSYAVLGLAAVFEGGSFTIAVRGLAPKRQHHGIAAWWRRIERSKDPSVFTVFLEDFAALLGIAVAAIGLALHQFAGLESADGVASVVIGLLLAAVAFVVARESRKLLVGESATPEVVESIRAAVVADESVHGVVELLTMQMSPVVLLVNVSVTLHESPDARAVLAAVRRIRERVIAAQPAAKHVYVQPVVGPTRERGVELFEAL
jgi:cation diffusion facilitator family transporter